MARSKYDRYLSNSPHPSSVGLAPFVQKKIRIFSNAQDLSIMWTMKCLDLPINLHTLQLTNRTVDDGCVLIYSCTTGRPQEPKPSDFPTKTFYITSLWTLSSFNPELLTRYSSFQTPTIAGGGNQNYRLR